MGGKKSKHEDGNEEGSDEGGSPTVATTNSCNTMKYYEEDVFLFLIFSFFVVC